MRLFFALWPDTATRAQLESLACQVQHRCGGRRTAIDKLHITLAFLGDVTPQQAETLTALTPSLSLPSGTWSLDRLGYFPRGGVLWAGSQASPVPLEQFHVQLRESLVDLGFTPDRRPFRPHVTLLRKARRPAENTSEELPIAWGYQRAALVHSAVGGSGRRYITLAETSLTDE